MVLIGFSGTDKTKKYIEDIVKKVSPFNKFTKDFNFNMCNDSNFVRYCIAHTLLSNPSETQIKNVIQYSRNPDSIDLLLKTISEANK